MFPRWVKINPSGILPKPRHGHRAVAIKELIVIFGGGNGVILDEMYVFNTEKNHWFTPAVKGQIPSGRAAYGIAHDNTRIIIHGGLMERFIISNEVFELQTTEWKWQELKPRTPKGLKPCTQPRFGHSFTLIQNKMYLFGGLTTNSNCIVSFEDSMEINYSNDLCTLDLHPNGSTVWSKPAVFGRPPPARESHTSVVHQGPKEHYKLFIYGGMVHNIRLGDLWALSIASMTWQEIETNGPQPLPRSLHTANIFNDKMYIFGGWVPLLPSDTRVTTYENEWKVTNELACLDLGSLEWNILSNNSPEVMPKARAGHCAVTINGKIFIWSGRDGYRRAWNNQVCFNDFWYLEINKPFVVSHLQLNKADNKTLKVNWAAAESADCYLLQIHKFESTCNTGPMTTNSIRRKVTPLVKGASKGTCQKEQKKTDAPQVEGTYRSLGCTPDLAVPKICSPPLLKRCIINSKQEISTSYVLQKKAVLKTSPKVLLTPLENNTFANSKTTVAKTGNTKTSTVPVLSIEHFLKRTGANIIDLKCSQVLTKLLPKNTVTLNKPEGSKNSSINKNSEIYLKCVPSKSEGNESSNLRKDNEEGINKKTVSNTVHDSRTVLSPSSIKIKRIGWLDSVCISWDPPLAGGKYITRYSVLLCVKKEVHPSAWEKIYFGQNTKAIVSKNTLDKAEIDMSKGVPTRLLLIFAHHNNLTSAPVSVRWVLNQ